MKEIEKYLAEQKIKIEYFRNKFPTLFSQLKSIDCQEGWYPLIEDLCETIEGYTNFHMPDELQDQLNFAQIKQKFGELRVVMNHWNSYIEGAISMAEGYSSRICEKCGDKGQPRNIHNWITTLCDKHNQEELERETK